MKIIVNGNILIVIAIASAITVTIAVLLVVLTPTQKDVNNKTSEFEETNEINSMLKKTFIMLSKDFILII